MFQEFKSMLVDLTMLAKDALHIYVALLVFFGSCILFRWKSWQVQPLLAVLIAALLGEAWDLRASLASDLPIHLAMNAKDVVNTLVVPAIIMLTARYTKLYKGR